MVEQVQICHHCACTRHDAGRCCYRHCVIGYFQKPDGIGRCRCPFSRINVAERVSLAESLDYAAGQLDEGIDRHIVNEYIGAAIGVQPTSGQWASTVNSLLQNAHSADTVIYAENLRKLAKGLRQ